MGKRIIVAALMLSACAAEPEVLHGVPREEPRITAGSCSGSQAQADNLVQFSYRFDIKGDLVETQAFARDGLPSGRETTLYDDAHRLVERRVYPSRKDAAAGTYTSLEGHDYDDQGRDVASLVLDPGTHLHTYSQYSGDAPDPVAVWQAGADEQVFSRWEYELDEHGQWLRGREVLPAEGRHQTFTRLDGGRQVLVQTFVHGGLVSSELRTYDERDGQLVEARFDAVCADDPDWILHYDLDDQVRPVRRTYRAVVRSTGRVVRDETMNWSYDDFDRMRLRTFTALDQPEIVWTFDRCVMNIP